MNDINNPLSRKLIAFDLKQDLLKLHYPKPKDSNNEQHHKKAYTDIEKFMEKAGWEHRQGSGYISQNALDTFDVVKFVTEITAKLPWLPNCIGKFDVANIGQEYDLRETFAMAAERTQKALANKTNVKESAVSKAEQNDKPNPPARTKKTSLAERQANAQTRIEAQSNARNGRSPNKNNEER